MSRLKNLKVSPSMIVSIIALVAALGGTAYAATKITSKDISNNAVTSPKVKNKTLKTKDFSDQALGALKGAKGDTGAQGPKGEQGIQGEQGPPGTPGSNATYANPEWSPISRNTIGSPVEELAAGPIVGTAANEKPPYGVGSLNLEVNSDPASTTNFGTEKASFGNQVDFVNQNVSDLTQLGFHVFQTGEDAGRGNPNMPTISIEIDPNLNSTPSNFSTLQFLPAQSPVQNKWSGYIDATTTPASPSGTGFTLSGAAGTQTGCNITTPCTFSQVKTALANGTGAKILTVAVTKGRDYAFQGAVDGLRVNGTIYDFEPFGVNEVPAS